MSDYRHLSKAPIAEALLDIRVLARTGFDPESFRAVAPELRNTYPYVEEQRGFETAFGVRNERLLVQTERELGLRGILLWSGDRKALAQFRIDGFTLNRLKPYKTWESLSSEARQLWPTYVKAASPERVTRLALRYINRIATAWPAHDLSEYLASPPSLPPGLTMRLSGFLTALTVEDIDTGLAANVTTALEMLPGSAANLILDIDAFKITDLEPEASAVWKVFDQLHDLKNRVFFAAVTKEVIESCK